jgi:hypothetical protein
MKQTKQTAGAGRAFPNAQQGRVQLKHDTLAAEIALKRLLPRLATRPEAD